MRVYQPVWKRLVGLSALFTLGFLMIVMSLSRNDTAQTEQEDPLVTESRTTRTTFSQAISFVGGKLKLLVVYNEETSPDQSEYEQYSEDDIVAEEQSEEDVNQYDYEDKSENEIFQKGDFDYSSNANKTSETTTMTLDITNKTLELTTEEETMNETHPTKTYFVSPLRKLNNRFKSHSTGFKTIKSESNLTLIEDGVFWAKDIEDLVPKCITDEDVSDFLNQMHRLKVMSVEPPTWNRCGRPKNQFVVFEDGTQVCARYRAPHNYLVQGEVMSFYLSRLMGIYNVPPVTLLSINGTDQWSDINVNKSLEAAAWTRNATVAVIQWIEGLERDRMPQLLLDNLAKGETISSSTKELLTMSPKQIVELLQWSDLILFDYVTGNYDRVASMQDAADREKKPSILGETIHNLVKSRKTESIWLIDNESGLLDAYSLLYGEGGASTGNSISSENNRFVAFHRKTLNTMCLFRRSTYERLKWLSRQTKPVKFLLNFLRKYEPNFSKLPSVLRHAEFVTNFKKRLVEAYSHIKKCRTLL